MAIIHQKNDSSETLRNPLLRPLYEKIDSIKEELDMGCRPVCQDDSFLEHVYFNLDIEDFNSNSSLLRKRQVESFLDYLNGKPADMRDVQKIEEFFSKYPKYGGVEDLFSTDIQELCYNELKKSGKSFFLSDGNVVKNLGSENECHNFVLNPDIQFIWLAPDVIALSEVKFNSQKNKYESEIFSLVSCPYNKLIEEEYLSPVFVDICFVPLAADCESSNDLINSIECGRNVSSVSLVTARKYRSENSDLDYLKYDEAVGKQMNEELFFKDWLIHPDISAFDFMKSSAEAEALNNCFQTIKERIGWNFENIDVDFLRDSFAVLSQKGELRYVYHEISFNGKELKIQRTGEKEISFISDNKVIQSHTLDYCVSGKKLIEPKVTVLNGVSIDSSKFCDDVYYQSVRYKYNRLKKKEEYVDIMLSEDFSVDSAIRLAKHFIEQYVGPNDVLNVEKDKSEFNYENDTYDFYKNKDAGTASQLFGRLMDDSNLSPYSSVGKVTLTCKGDTMEIWFRSSSDGYNYPKCFRFKASSEVFPDIKVVVRDKNQCIYEKKERSYSSQRKRSW